MPAPVARMKKSEIIWLSRNKCRHGHDYLSHYNCYIEENPDMARVGFLDIETSNFKANFGIMLTWCIKQKDGSILEDAITEKDLKSGNFDKLLLSLWLMLFRTLICSSPIMAPGLTCHSLDQEQFTLVYHSPDMEKSYTRISTISSNPSLS